MKDQQKPPEPEPEEVKEEVKAPETWTQTTRDPNTGDLMTEEKPHAKAR